MKKLLIAVLFLAATVHSFDMMEYYPEGKMAKYSHVTTSASINLVAYNVVGYIHPELDWRDKLALSNFYAFGFGLSKEVYDDLSGGHFSREDMYYNASGLFISTAVILIMHHFKILK